MRGGHGGTKGGRRGTRGGRGGMKGGRRRSRGGRCAAGDDRGGPRSSGVLEGTWSKKEPTAVALTYTLTPGPSSQIGRDVTACLLLLLCGCHVGALSRGNKSICCQ